MLKSIISEEITDIKVDCNPITEKDLLDDKVGILDIKAKLNNNTNCNIEMQVVNNNDIEKRLLFYWSKMYASSIKAGDQYKNLEKCIVILITDYNLNNLKDFKEYLTKWNIREEKHTHYVLTDVLEIYIIEANKAKKYANKEKNTLNSWLQFINNPKEKLLMENEEIKKAKKVLEEISQDEREQWLTELRQKYIMDQHSIYDAGYYKGIEEGISQGVAKSQTKIVKRMYDEKMDIRAIAKITGLTEEDINKIINEK